MPSCQRIFADINNALPAADLTASPVRAATRQVFRQQTVRAGNGQVVLRGGYTGIDDATVEIEIQAASGTVARVTQPVFTGAGNGTMTQPTAEDGTASQDFSATLVDLGTATTRAQAILYANVLLRAKVAGVAGNTIRLNITPQLTVGATLGVLAADLSRDTQEWTDQKLDFGAVPLMPDGTLSSECPRLIFGGDTSKVYRHYKRWDGEQWQYGISPKLAAAYPAGALGQAVSGNYLATITDGVTTETHVGTTLYDLLLAFLSSSLISVETPPANDKTPNGMAAIDVPIRTAAFAMPIEKSRSDLSDLSGVVITPTAPTESVTITCIDDSRVNQERWAVKSKVAGALAEAITGTGYTSGFASFTIPTVALDSRPVEGRIGISEKNFPRDADSADNVPAVCLYRPILGAAATETTLRLVWSKRPGQDCNCEESSVSGRPREEWLGVDLGDEDMAALLPGHRARLEKLTAWYKTFVAANTEKTATGELRSAENDIRLAEMVVGELHDCLSDLYTNADAVLVEEAWEASTVYEVDAVVEPTTENGYRYRASARGNTGASAPAWPVAIGSTVVDGAVTWTCVSKTAPRAWDAVLSGVTTDLAPLSAISPDSGAGILRRTAGQAYAVGDIAYTSNSAGASVYLRCVKAIATAASLSAAVFDVPIGVLISDSVLNAWLVISSAEALGSISGGSADINIIAAQTGGTGVINTMDEFVKRYSAACDEVRVIAGLPPKKSSAGSSGSGIWRDAGTDYFVIAGTDNLQVFPNVYYHSCTRATDEDGKVSIVPTYEYGFALRIGCLDRIQYGDSITITIGDVSVQRPYKVDDVYIIPVVSGGPLRFNGGVNGDDTLTWAVAGSESGALAQYALTADESLYTASGITFGIHRGGIPFALGDTFRFSIEAGGRWRWRKDDDAWSADLPLASSAVLTDGLEAVFTEGAAPSFVAGDIHRFRVRQPYSPLHALSADDAAWQWSSDTATLRLDFPEDQTIEAVGVLRHSLSASAAVLIEALDAADAPLASINLPVAPGPILAFVDPPITNARAVRVIVTGAANMGIGWLYAGVPWAAENSANRCVLRRVYTLERSDGINPAGTYLGAGRDGELGWDDWFLPADLTSLLALLDDVKSKGDLPVVVVPNMSDTQDAALVRIATDSLEITDEYRFQDATTRQMSITLPLSAVPV